MSRKKKTKDAYWTENPGERLSKQRLVSEKLENAKQIVTNYWLPLPMTRSASRKLLPVQLPHKNHVCCEILGLRNTSIVGKHQSHGAVVLSCVVHSPTTRDLNTA